MTLDEAIRHAEEVVDKKEREKQKWERWLETDSDYRAVSEKVSCELCAEEHRQLVEWLKELKQLRDKTRWIPISERLPEKYTYTLWCASSGCVRSDYFNGEFWEDAKKYCYEVIAWMPLPEPYKAESEEV